MVVGYIKEENFINRPFKKMQIKSYGSNYIIAISAKAKYQKSVKPKLIKCIKRLNIDTIVFSMELQKEFKASLCNTLEENNIQILNGKRLMEFMQFDIVKYIFDKQEIDMKNEEIYIIFKKTAFLDLNFLKKYIEEFRLVNIVTNDIKRLKTIQDSLLDSSGILISVSNNKKKALKRARYILNLNLTKQELLKYNINRNAVIINIAEDVKYDSPSFDGINVNNIKIECTDEYMEQFEQIGNNFDITELYESIIINSQKWKIEDAYERISKDDIKIIQIIGNNGAISNEELQKIHNLNLDKRRKLV